MAVFVLEPNVILITRLTPAGSVITLYECLLGVSVQVAV